MLPDQARQWVTHELGGGSRIVSAHRLRLGGWHVNHALEVVDAHGDRQRLVLRRWARPGWELDDPDYTADREARVLQFLGTTAVPAPHVVAADTSGRRCDVPALLLTRLDGHPPRRADAQRDGFCRQLAETLALVHEIRGAKHVVPAYRLYFDREHAAPAAWMPATAVWRRATAAVREPPPTSAVTLIHRDYHPLNTLWSRGRLTGLVDWTQACVGPPSLDLGHMRWNLVADHGQDIADRFLACYRACTGRALEEQPYWDLVSLLDLLLAGDDPGDIEPADLRRFEAYARMLLAGTT
jgi:aminoglycoside phosphotransferase (APT) family kinase protein